LRCAAMVRCWFLASAPHCGLPELVCEGAFSSTRRIFPSQASCKHNQALGRVVRTPVCLYCQSRHHTAAMCRRTNIPEDRLHDAAYPAGAHG
jgi:hypothetical protein